MFSVSNEDIVYGERIQTFSNGSLWISSIAPADAANYTCRAENVHGADQILVELRVQGNYNQLYVFVALISSSQVFS